MTALVEASGVTRTFGSQVAVDAASLDVGAGELVGLIGANGAGKTTLIRMLLGLLVPTDGSVALFGEPPSRRTRSRLGYVPQGLGLYRDLTVDQNVAFVARAFGRPPQRTVLPADLAASRGALVGSIGLGHQRQLAFACALAHEPELLVLDEPTSGVSPLARARLWDQIHEQADKGVGVLVTTHYLQEAQQCDRLVVMAEGREVASGTIEAVIGGRQAVSVSSASWSSLYDALRSAGLAVTLDGTSVRVVGATLEQVDRALQRAGLSGALERVPASLEETVLLIGRDAQPTATR